MKAHTLDAIVGSKFNASGLQRISHSRQMLEILPRDLPFALNPLDREKGYSRLRR
jgi:hypothetical protein